MTARIVYSDYEAYDIGQEDGKWYAQHTTAPISASAETYEEAIGTAREQFHELLNFEARQAQIASDPNAFEGDRFWNPISED